MPIQRSCRTDLYVPNPVGYLTDNKRQITFKVNAEGEEIGNHQDVVDTPRHQRFHGAFQAGFA